MATISKEKKDQAISLLKLSKLSSDEIAHKLALPLPTVRAIKANVTRGAYSNKETSPAEKEKWRMAQKQAQKTGRNAKKFTKYRLLKAGYKCIDFDTKKGYEYIGIVDLVAVKRDRKNPDLLTIVLFQVKGRGARITQKEEERLRMAVRRIKVKWNVAQKPSTAVKFQKPLL